MANCKDCFHFDVCMDYTSLKDSKFAQEFNETDILCDHFRPAANVIVPPVKVGDYVYYIKGGYYKNPKNCEISRPCKVVEVSSKLQRNGSSVMQGFITDNGTRYSFGGVGKTVFLTRAEAEQALEDMRKG